MFSSALEQAGCSAATRDSFCSRSSTAGVVLALEEELELKTQELARLSGVVEEQAARLDRLEAAMEKVTA